MRKKIALIYPLLMGAMEELNVGAEDYVLTCGAAEH